MLLGKAILGSQLLGRLVEKIQFYIEYQGLPKFIVEAVILLLIFGFILYFLYRYTNKKWLTLSIIFFVALFGVTVLLNLTFIYKIYKYLVLIYAFVWAMYFAPNIKNVFEGLTKPKNVKNFVNNEEQQKVLIDTLIKTVTHLSERQIGAIITIEKEDSLNTYIAKGTHLNCEVSCEILETIFMPGTALHDGAVIIREDKIMSAGSFYPTSETTKISKTLGSRHRAALGISEVSDAFTIIVSEETGNISTTHEGSLTTVTIDGLQSFLKEHIIVK